MRCLVTGGAGFIGSNLCERLLNEGHEVICYDNFIAGKTENVFHLLDRDFRIVRADVRDHKMLDRAMNGVDYVFHQAASKKNVCDIRPDIDCEVNAKGTFLVCQAAKKHNVKKIIHASTGSVYGEQKYLQESSPLMPVSYYGVSKLAGEKYVAMFGIPYTIFRYFHVYGPRQDAGNFGGVVAIFISRFLKKQPVTIFGNGDQVRSFTFVSDVVWANILAMNELGKLTSRQEPCVYNCASGIKISLNELLDILDEKIGKVERIYEPWKPGDIKHFAVDNSNIINDYHIEFTDFKTGLDATIRYYQSVD